MSEETKERLSEFDCVFLYDPRRMEDRSLSAVMEKIKAENEQPVELLYSGKLCRREVMYLLGSLKVALEFPGEETLKVLLGGVLPTHREKFGLPKRNFSIQEREQLLYLHLLEVKVDEATKSRHLAIPENVKILMPNCCGMKKTRNTGSLKLTLHNPIKGET